MRARIRSSVASSSAGRNSCSGGSRSRIVTGRPAIASKMPSKSDCWNGSSRSSAARRPASVSARIISCTTGSRSSPKNMCSVRQRPIPSAPNSRARAASSGVSAFARTRQAPRVVGPAEDRLEVLVDLRRHERDLADEDAAGAAVDRDHVALGERLGRRAAPSAALVDRQRLAARDARLAHPARDDGRVRGHAAVHGEDPLRGDHPVDVVGRRLPADEDHRAVLRRARPPCRRRRRSRRSPRPGDAFRPPRRLVGAAVGIDHRVQELVELRRVDAARPPPRARSAPPRPSTTATFSAAAAVRFAARVCSR